MESDPRLRDVLLWHALPRLMPDALRALSRTSTFWRHLVLGDAGRRVWAASLARCAAPVPAAWACSTCRQVLPCRLPSAAYAPFITEDGRLVSAGDLPALFAAARLRHTARSRPGALPAGLLPQAVPVPR